MPEKHRGSTPDLFCRTLSGSAFYLSSIVTRTALKLFAYASECRDRLLFIFQNSEWGHAARTCLRLRTYSLALLSTASCVHCWRYGSVCRSNGTYHALIIRIYTPIHCRQLSRSRLVYTAGSSELQADSSLLRRVTKEKLKLLPLASHRPTTIRTASCSSSIYPICN